MDEQKLGALLARLTQRHGVPGAQLVVRTAVETLSVHTGRLRHDADPEVTDSTAFPIGSLTKPFTATVAMVLVDDEDIELDEPLAEHLPVLGEPLPGTGERLTLRRLLSHTGGVASNVEDDAVTAANRLRWIAGNATERQLAHPPGALFSYSNIGYVIAGQVVESVTGMSWREAVSSILLRPLAIQPGFVLDPTGPRPIAAGHTVDLDRGRTVPLAEQGLPLIEEPNGGLAVSAKDLAALAVMHLGAGKSAPLSTRGRAEMATDQLDGIDIGPFGMADGWGLGWAIYRDNGGTWLGHDGTGDGTSCHLRFEPVTGTVVALTTNAGTGIDLWEELVGELRALGVAVGHHPMTGMPSSATQTPASPACAGRFVNGGTEFVISAAEDGALLASLGGDEMTELVCFDGLRFTVRESEGNRMSYTGRFVRDPGSGSVDLLQLSGRVARRLSANPQPGR